VLDGVGVSDIIDGWHRGLRRSAANLSGPLPALLAAARLQRAAQRDRRPISSLARLLLQDALRDRDQEASHDD
jgi:hypothetical protein